jgi:glycosyltransferase involved in cell wall biosynthesis
MITYNHELYIHEAIEGILIQKTNFSIELIIGEDCSTDRTREIVFDYAKKYPNIIRVITSEKNVGIVNNFIRTLKASIGKYIALCEGDDYWIDEYKLKKEIDILEKESSVGLVCSECERYDQSNNTFLRSKKIKTINTYTVRDLMGMNPINTLTVIFRSYFLPKIFDYLLSSELNPEWNIIDLALWFIIAYDSKILKIPDITGVYRILHNSASGRSDINKEIKFCESVLNIKETFILKYELGSNSLKEATNFYYEQLLIVAKKYNNKKLANKIWTEMKIKKEGLTLKNFLRYLRIKFSIINNLILIVKETLYFIDSVFSKKNNETIH